MGSPRHGIPRSWNTTRKELVQSSPVKRRRVIDTARATPYDAHSSELLFMARTSGILQPDVNRAPYIAQGALCVLAAASVLGAVIGMSQRTDGMMVPRRDAALEQAE